MHTKNYFMMRSVFHKIIPWLWAAVWFTLPLSMRANAFSLIIFALSAVVFALFEKPVMERRQMILTALFILFFAWHAISLAFDPGPYNMIKLLERKLSLVVIPVILLLVSGTVKELGKWALRGFFTGLFLTGCWFLVVALVKLFTGKPPDSFTYHEFTRPASISAIYYSCFLSTAIFMLTFRRMEGFIERVKIPLLIFFILLMFLCASKLFIILTIPLVIWVVIRDILPKQGFKRIVISFIALLMLAVASVPVVNRISELKNTDFRVVTREVYAYDTPLNGLTFRLILWRFAGEIMTEENAWLTGTGIGSKQAILNGYYYNYGMYIGNANLGDTGYLGYNFHNQYLETLVGTGIPGLIILLSIIFFNFFFKGNKQFFPTMVYFTLTLFFFTESMLERQAGIVFFCLIWTLNVHFRDKVVLNYGENLDHHPQ